VNLGRVEHIRGRGKETWHFLLYRYELSDIYSFSEVKCFCAHFRTYKVQKKAVREQWSVFRSPWSPRHTICTQYVQNVVFNRDLNFVSIVSRRMLLKPFTGDGCGLELDLLNPV